ncbi:hypothetical protein [Micromonospora sp. WMMD710]|uniref:hypothetical protein n=1 Tax=Micromonospora sp. WMMD710 TaxID=3016085 RepID=UPI002416F5A5|nr:hypothetical protein [Micromonospora sp. WMMD710]MDG4758016.1 hypothetical protein [Micromonospora sp. WMMD710]
MTLTGVTVQGRLNLSQQHLAHGLLFRDCHFDDGVDLRGAVCEELIQFVGCELNDLHADNIIARKGFSVVDCQLRRVSFASAQITEDLRLSKSRLSHEVDHVALHGPNMVIEKSLRLDETWITGEVRIPFSHVGQDLDLRSAHLDNGAGLALDATSVIVGGQLRGDDGFTARGEIRLCWGRMSSISFRAAELHKPGGVALRADSIHVSLGCYLDQGLTASGTVRLVGAQIDGELACTASTFTSASGAAIEAERLVAKDVYLDRGFRADGVVRLVGAQLARQLTCTGGHFENPAGDALDLTGITCTGSVYLNQDPQHEQCFHAHGRVQMCGASIGESLVCSSGLFEFPGGVALDADGLNAVGDVRLNQGFRAVGRVRLSRATIGRQLDCGASSFVSTENPALDLTGLVGHGDVLLTSGFRAAGQVRMRDADVSRDVDLSTAHLEGTGTKVFDAFGLRVGGTFTFQLAQPPKAEVDVRFADVRRLNDSPSSWPTRQTSMEGLTYQSVSNIPCSGRIEILQGTKAFSLQPYRQLGKVYREASKTKEEREVLIAGLRDYRNRGKLKWPQRMWNLFLEHTVGYGYRLWRPFVIALALVVLNFPIYHTAEHHNLMESVGAKESQEHHNVKHCPTDFPCFNPLAYSIQLFIPVSNLHEVDKWVPDATRGWWSTFLLGWTWLMIIIGWLLAAALGAGLSQAVRRQ